MEESNSANSSSEEMETVSKKRKIETNDACDTITITRNQVTPWVSTKIPVLIGMKTLAYQTSTTCERCEELLPTIIDIHIIDDTTTREFADFLTLASLFRTRLVTEWMKTYIMNHIRLIVRVCNDDILSFCKTLVRSAEDVLKILEFADNGNYQWISDNLSEMLLLHVQNQKEYQTTIRNLDPHLFKHILLNVSKRFKFLT